MEFASFFSRAMGSGMVPFPHQCALADEPIQDRVLCIPTGGGKTAAAILSWVYRRLVDPEHTPLRLVYVLPTRGLVHQTVRCAEKWLENLQLDRPIRVWPLLGSDPELAQRQRDWTSRPEEPAILIGTLDLLLSGALNRGYAMSRAAWPTAFGLLGNDVLFVLDETQLMGNACATFAQLAHFRSVFGTARPVFTWWMSATQERNWLKTVDYSVPPEAFPAGDLRTDSLAALGPRWTAAKPLQRLKTLSADEVLRCAPPGALTLVVCNTVARAQGLAEELGKEPKATSGRKRKAAEPMSRPVVLLVHSRFRTRERERLAQRLVHGDAVLRGKPTEAGAEEEWLAEVKARGLIVVATQVVEAGLDLSASVLLTELAPWSSVVQRFGRLNREGLQTGARAYWIDVKDRDAAPYTPSELQAARQRITTVEDAGPATLAGVALPEPAPPDSVLRQHDFHALFSTEPDLAGGFTDISPYLRETDERDGFVFWRDLKHGSWREQAAPTAEELCRVPLYGDHGLQGILRGAAGWVWDVSQRSWRRIQFSALTPGMTVMLAQASGGYSEDRGWTGLAGERPKWVGVGEGGEPDSNGGDRRSLADWAPLDDHLRAVEAAALGLARHLKLSEDWGAALGRAGLWHDVGKAHPQWQGAIAKAVDEVRDGVWAKFPGTSGRAFRPGLRHEEVSALLAFQQWRSGLDGWSPLAVYLVASHHGKVRTALGVQAAGVPDTKVPVALEGWLDEPTCVNAELMGFASPATWHDDGTVERVGSSWTELVHGLLGSEEPVSPCAALGPFRLAYLEAILRAADRAVSAGGVVAYE